MYLKDSTKRQGVIKLEMGANSVKNEKLYDALLSLTKVILEMVSSRIQSDPVAITESVWSKQGEGLYVKNRIQRPDWKIVLQNAIDVIKKTQEFSDFLNLVNADEVISPQLDTLVGTCLGSYRLEALSLALWPVYEFLTDQEIVGFSIPIFNAVYSRIESALYAQEIEFENITPLCGFTMVDSEISLTENIAIVKLGEREILEFFSLGIKLGHSMDDFDVMCDVHQYAIKISYTLPKVIGLRDRDTSRKEIEQNEYFGNKNEQAVLDALRIYKEGKLYPISTVRRSKSILWTRRGWNFEASVRPSMNNMYRLSRREAKEFKSLWNAKTKSPLPQKHFLSVGIRRFSQSNERDIVEDRIIDLMIAAEAIFLSSSGGIQGELKYRLSHRASMFIETDVDLQKAVFNFMQKAYDVRSAIVHGSNPKLPNKMDGSSYTIEEFCGDIEKYLRISIKKAIDHVSTAKENASRIDWNSVIFPAVN